MNWTLDKSRPICPQICEIICVAIANGEFAGDEKLLSVREVALLAGVNPNTVQKSFEELEQRGVIHSVRCSGWYVNENTDVAVDEVNSLRLKKTREYIASMAQLGCDTSETLKYINEYMEANNE